MKSPSSIKFVMMMQSNCPIFQWGNAQEFPIFEQLSMNISGFFGAFNALINLLQANNLLSENDQLDNVKFDKTRIYFRDNGIFQSIYIIESVGLRNKKLIDQVMNKIDKKFLGKFANQLENWDHSIEPFKEFKEFCDKIL